MTTTAIAPQPLKGVRIVDLTWMLASAGTTVLLSSLGAEVIRIEWPGHLDFTRRQLVAKPKPPPLGPLKKLSDLPRSVRDMPEANSSGLFSDRNAGKLGITLNMRHRDGVALFKKLVAVSDIVIEGFRPNAMRSWGLDYETLKAVKPDIIYLQMAGFGRTGPYASFASYGPTAQVMSGIGALTGLPRSASAHDVESFLHGRDAALLRRHRADGGAVLSQPHRSGPVHRSGAVRTGPLPQRHRGAGLQRAWTADRPRGQSLAVHRRGAARNLPLRRR